MRIVIALRATISMAVGIFITFNQSHSASVGLLALAIFGLGSAVLNGIGTFVWVKGLMVNPTHKMCKSFVNLLISAPTPRALVFLVGKKSSL